MAKYDTVVVGGTAVLPGRGAVRADIGMTNGRIAAVGELDPAEADEVVDASGKLVLPGAIDAHFHLGIYRDLAADTSSETTSAVAGGVTTILSYFRTGHHYLNRTGPYADVFPEVLAVTAGLSRCDFGYHLAPMTDAQVDEIPALVAEHGVQSFEYTMSGAYDLGHLMRMMEKITEANRTHGDRRVSLSIHAEQPELIRVFVERTQGQQWSNPLEEYSHGRPPLTERLAVTEAGVLAEATRCPVNFLHLSSAEALEAALKVRRENAGVDVRLETTLHHLALTYERYGDQRGKVNPPIRSEADLERLWQGMVAGDIDWVCSDHACCSEEHKEGELWSALPGFGGTALLYPVMLTEGLRRGLSLERVVDLVATNPARAYGLYGRKGALVVGADADVAVVDAETEAEVTTDRLLSAQDHTPFAGMKLTGWPERTLLRGVTVFRDGAVVGEPTGSYLSRPLLP